MLATTSADFATTAVEAVATTAAEELKATTAGGCGDLLQAEADAVATRLRRLWRPLLRRTVILLWQVRQMLGLMLWRPRRPGCGDLLLRAES
jgi:hypothetical protein